MRLSIIILAVLLVVYGSAALGYHWATRNHRDWMEAGWDHLHDIATYRTVTVQDYINTFGEQT